MQSSAVDRARVAIAVHRYHPHVGGSETHVRCIAAGLAERGHDVLVLTPRAPGEPGRVDGIAVNADAARLDDRDVLVTYSVSDATLAVAERARERRDRIAWLHHPCAAAGPASLAMIRDCDVVLAMNPLDVALAASAGRAAEAVTRIVPAPDPRRVARDGGAAFRERFGVAGPYVVWAGAWLPAKGVRSLSRRFAALRRARPDLPARLIMFGAYGDEEWPDPHDDLLVVRGNAGDLPSALAGCAFVAFNSPPHPVGYDANPLILLEALAHGRTFVAQEGTPFLPEISHLGYVVRTDDEWVRAASRLLEDGSHRRWLEGRCRAAAARTYTLPAMLDGLEGAMASARPLTA